MGFFKKKDNLTIPPVEPAGGVPDRRPSPQPMRGGGRPDPYTSNSNGGGRNNGGPQDPYAGAGGYQPREHKDPYAAVQADRAMGGNPNNPYARKGVPTQADRDTDAARAELFAGMKPQSSQQPSREGSLADTGRPPSYATEEDSARAELFGGLQNEGGEIPAVKRREYGYTGRELEEDFDEDEEIEGIKQGMRETKQDSLASTR